MLTNEQVLADINSKFGDYVTDVADPFGMLTFTTTREKLVDLFKYLYDHKEFQYQFLTTLCGVHYPDQVGRELGVVYHLHSLVQNHRIRIKTFVPIDNPLVPTLTGLFNSANWQERETYDFFGIEFTGHPDLRRIMNVDEMDYFPLRKEYPLEDQQRRDKDDRMFGR
jgi:NADH-quinone oxidoreductase subunit C